MGRETVLALGEAGHDLTLFNRGSHRVEWPFEVKELTGDRTLDRELEQLSGRDFETVIDFAAYSGEQVRQLLRVIPEEAHLVLISSGAVYKPVPELPWAEDGPYGPWDLWGQYGQGKIDAEQAVHQRPSSSASSVLLRLPYVLGPYNYADREEFVLNRLMDDEVILVPGDGQAVIQYISAKQVARAIAAVIEQVASDRPSSSLAQGTYTFNLASPNCLSTLVGLVEVCSRIAGKVPKIRQVADIDDPGAGSPLVAKSLIFPFPNQSYILDTQRAERVGILSPRTSLAEMISESYEALMRSPDRRSWSRTEGERTALGQ